MNPKPSPARYNMRPVFPQEIEIVRGGGWNLTLLQKYVDKFVLHYDVAAFSKICYKVLHDMRFLSVHFMLDVDGVIYQTLDLKERAWHATIANSNSIGIEIANIGAYGVNATNPFNRYYERDAHGTKLIIPPNSILTQNFLGRPRKNEPVIGTIQKQRLVQYDLTQQQYNALIKLTHALTKIFPKLKLQYPNRNGELIRETLTPEELLKFGGIVGHFHVQDNKVDPGPALDWNYLINSVKKLNKKKRKHLIH